MDKIPENSMTYDLIHKPLILWAYMYILSVLGVFCKYYFNFKDSSEAMIVTYLLFMVILIMFKFYEWKSTRDILKDDDLNWESRKYLLDYNHDLYYKDKKMIYFKLAIIIIFTFLIGLNAAFSEKLSLVDFTSYILTTFGISIYSLHLLLYDEDGDNLIYNSFYGFLINSIIVLFLLIFKFNFGIFTAIFNIIMGHINNFFILSLTVILLGATFSLVAFTYYMVLDDKDNSKFEMRSIGEKFFISTLFAMFFLIIVFVISMYCTHSSILLLGNINFIEKSSFIMVNIFVILLFLFLYTLIISLKYLLTGVFSSLNNLPFKF